MQKQLTKEYSDVVMNRFSDNHIQVDLTGKPIEGQYTLNAFN